MLLVIYFDNGGILMIFNCLC